MRAPLLRRKHGPDSIAAFEQTESLGATAQLYIATSFSLPEGGRSLPTGSLGQGFAAGLEVLGFQSDKGVAGEGSPAMEPQTNQVFTSEK
jgi:hypothetical protein